MITGYQANHFNLCHSLISTCFYTHAYMIKINKKITMYLELTKTCKNNEKKTLPIKMKYEACQKYIDVNTTTNQVSLTLWAEVCNGICILKTKHVNEITNIKYYHF